MAETKVKNVLRNDDLEKVSGGRKVGETTGPVQPSVDAFRPGIGEITPVTPSTETEAFRRGDITPVKPGAELNAVTPGDGLNPPTVEQKKY